MRVKLRQVIIPVIVLGLVGGLMSCRSGGKTRPFGYFRLGKIAELLEPETQFANFGLILRHDSSGFSVMSTYCTYDLAALELRQGEAGPVLVCPRSGSAYSTDGRVLKGPAKANLPYFKLELAESEYGGPKDALYAAVGVERSPHWRLQVQRVDDKWVAKEGSAR